MNQTTADHKPADALATSWVDGMPDASRPYLRLMRLDRPIGTWLLFWPCLLGLELGAVASERQFGGWHDLYLLILFAVGSVVMRGAGCTYNDIVDRDIDAQVARTKSRPIPSGAVTLRQAWLFLAGQCFVGLLILVQLERVAFLLGAASLLLIIAYPFMKRITWWPQAWLGLTFNWGALMGFAAQTGTLDAAVAMLYVGLFFWTLGYDTIYALQDREDDALVGVKSTALLFGSRAADWILAFYAIAFTFVLGAGFAEHTGWPFAFLMFAAGAHLLWQARTLDADDPTNCLKLFRANRDTGALLGFAFLLSSWIW